MKRTIIPLVTVCLWMSAAFSAAFAGAPDKGEADFNDHCALCHPHGANIVNPVKKLAKKQREAHHIMSETDIINLVRSHPGPGMTKFDAKTLSDAETKRIAAYIMKTFK